MYTYKTFLRSSVNWGQFSSARKMTQERGLTYEQAKEACATYNKARTIRQIKRGTMLEFTLE